MSQGDDGAPQLDLPKRAAAVWRSVIMKISRSVILAIAVSVLGLMAIGLGLTAFGGGCQAAHEKARHGVLAMDVFAQDAIVDLLLFEETPRGKELRHVRSRDGATTWSAPSTINRRGRGIVDHRRGMDPQIAAAGDTVVVLWTTPGTSAWGAGPLATAVSRDGGRTWTLGPNPADDTSNDGHSFLELAADETGAFQAFWLDSRNGAQGLRTAFSRDAGQTWSANASIDSRTCECCWNKAVAFSPGSSAVLYRDRSPRDMALAATTDGGRTWTRRATVGDFGWAIEACPHVGGGLARTRVGTAERLHAVVWTGKAGREGLHRLASRDDGRTWSKPARLGTARAKHGDIAGSAAHLAAVWDDVRAGQQVIRAATSDDEGASWHSPIQLSDSNRTATHPLVIWSDGRFVAFWTDAARDSPAAWRAVRIPAAEAH
ncbi:MAG: exo-alpha-sialidase [Luteitalea sp.]|nr:exo-alpha-sialidase [Luteitalea sp.]